VRKGFRLRIQTGFCRIVRSPLGFKFFYWENLGLRKVCCPLSLPKRIYMKTAGHFFCWVLASTMILATSTHAQPTASGSGPGAVEKSPTISVTGRGEVEAPPDRAVVRLGVESQAEEAAAAQSAANEVIQKAVAGIEKVGVPKPSIKTTGLNLVPIYAPQKPGRETQPARITGYRAMNTIQVELDESKLPLVGKVVDSGLEAGANRLEGISFELSKDVPQRTRALKLAVAEAQTKARAMAEALGVRLQGVDEATEGGVMIMPRTRAMRGVESASVMAGVPTQVEPGTLHVEASVTIHYRIAPGAAGAKSNTE
jgi:uncharacterized protein YggE